MTRSKMIALLGLVGLLACGDFDPSAPGSGPGDETRGPTDPDRFIVTVAESARPADIARGHGVEPDLVFEHVLNGFAGKIPAQAHEALLRNPLVERIEPDTDVATTETIQEGATWGLDRVDQRGNDLDGAYTYESTGAGVTVYIVDTGIFYGHQDFAGRAGFGFDRFGEDGSDCHGHGTHVAGTVGGTTYGVAKGVSLVSVRVLDCGGSGSVSGVVAGLDWIAANASGPSVVNMSLGGSSSETLNDAVARLVAGGAFVVVAAGNSSADACRFSPSGAPDAFTVASTDNTDRRSSFSNWGPCVDIFAPGRNITSAFPTSNTATAITSGTSMAAPHVAGAAALVLEDHPTFSPLQVDSVLKRRSTKGAVDDPRSDNWHLLYVLDQNDDRDPGPAPAPEPPPAPDLRGLGAGWTTKHRNPVITVSWAYDGDPGDHMWAAYRVVGTDHWYENRLDLAYYGSGWIGGNRVTVDTEYEVRIRALRGDYHGDHEWSDWSGTRTVRTCRGQGGSGRCSTK
jgi:subtilisin family serine protease